jgi:hypothetical protein
MKKLLALLAMFVLLTNAAGANVPDPDYCSVYPMDGMQSPRVIGIPDEDGVADSELHIWVRAFGGDPIENAFVAVIFNGMCDGLCICDAAAFTGYTDAQGHVVIIGQFGGCCEEICAVMILAEGVAIRAADYVVSPDYDGSQGDCSVDLPDFIIFSQYLGQTSGVTCADYTGDGACMIDDFIIFGHAWARSCTPAP